ncbi:DUF6479 family protein [Streptomyces sp. NPDC049040]|uniref:DUF6479 family protein n=1 Tax=Streptomyces sp. NPDC049040 TaxID=3365593 RepID=UPI00371A01C0
MFEAAPHPTYLASAVGTGWATFIGVVVVALIIAAFWWGARRARRRPVPPQSPQAGADSWHEPSPSETHHSAHSADADDKRA